VVFGVCYAENGPFERLGCEKEVLFKMYGQMDCPILLTLYQKFITKNLSPKI
jgi:hypothetical protein